jgi:hypothetical protein
MGLLRLQVQCRVEQIFQTYHQHQVMDNDSVRVAEKMICLLSLTLNRVDEIESVVRSGGKYGLDQRTANDDGCPQLDLTFLIRKELLG